MRADVERGAVEDRFVAHGAGDVRHVDDGIVQPHVAKHACAPSADRDVEFPAADKALPVGEHVADHIAQTVNIARLFNQKTVVVTQWDDGDLRRPACDCLLYTSRCV